MSYLRDASTPELGFTSEAVNFEGLETMSDGHKPTNAVYFFLTLEADSVFSFSFSGLAQKPILRPLQDGD
jgi:hypothetical protein